MILACVNEGEAVDNLPLLKLNRVYFGEPRLFALDSKERVCVIRF